jgi:hypothetical protein
MAELTARQLDWLRDELGAGETAAALQEAYDRTGSLRDAAVSFLRRRLNALSLQPLTVGISGVANFGFAENIKALERQIQRLVKLPSDPTAEVPDVDGEDPDVVPTIQIRSRPRRRRRR